MSVSPWEQLIGVERYGRLARDCTSPKGIGPAPLLLPHPALLNHMNAKLAASVFVVLAPLEVGLRNAMADQLQPIADAMPGPPAPWYQQTALGLHSRERESIDSAKRKAASVAGKARRDVIPADVLAQFSFGLWPALLATKYRTRLWRAGLRNAFPHLDASFGRQGVPDVFIAQRLQIINVYRNRIAHHEPVYRSSPTLDDVRRAIVTVSVCISPELEGAVKHHWQQMVSDPQAGTLPQVRTLI